MRVKSQADIRLSQSATKTVLRSLLFVSAVCAMGAVHNSGFSQVFVIQGMVTDAQRVPIPGAEVSLLEVAGNVLTRADGRFRLSIPASGRYTLRVRRVGFTARVMEVSTVEPIVNLQSIVLEAAPQILSEIDVKGTVPRPRFILRPTTYVSRMGGHRKPTYEVWDTHGASLSPNALTVVKQVSPSDAAVFYGWHVNISKTYHEYAIGAVGCPGVYDVPLSSAWIGWTDTVRTVYSNGATWKRRKNHFRSDPCVEISKIKDVDTLLNAGPLSGGWLIGHIRPNGIYTLSLHSANGQLLWEVPAPLFIRDRTTMKQAHFSSTQTGAIVAGASWPFAWWQIDASGVTRTSTTATTLPGLGDSIQYSKWTALSVLDVGSGFVQTIVSPGARDRMIIVYDASGRAFTATKQAGAPALLASDPERRRIIGIRFSSAGRVRGEIVEYEY